jgi:hypothetical protein
MIILETGLRVRQDTGLSRILQANGSGIRRLHQTVGKTALLAM